MSAQGQSLLKLPRKTYLLTPGPTPIPERVTQAMTRPLMHHRTPQFQALFEEVRQGLKTLFQTRSEVLTLATSGTGAMEAAVVNLFSRGDEVISVNGGKFGERWKKICEAYGIICHEIFVERGASVEIKQLTTEFANFPKSKAVLFQASETATGALMPTREIAEFCQKNSLLSVCDAITACGVFDLPMDAWKLDVLITGSQKALMIPPGLSFVAFSDNAWRAQALARNSRFYLDLAKELKAQLKNQTAWTPATSLLQGLQESLKMILEEGLPAMFARHALLAEATRAGVQALGLEILAKHPSVAVTAVRVPESILAQAGGGKQIPRMMRDRYGATIAGGQDELETKIFRLSHFGYCDRFDVITALSALELTLAKLGYPNEMGKGVSAALTVFSKHDD